MFKALTRQPKAVFLLLGVSALAACGDTVVEQAAIGGVGGLGTSAVLGGNLAAGAVVGAAGNVAYCQAFPDRCN
ncbi:hypothetical protein [Roseovarius nanhaiticus]|uniref:Lipoprotein n=1 Tax=Roseovarius nanhaiticus TaxID=573024 RepID=A0A1N7HE39_9RHOB|nr:hypothetical protein [Roseovarius nanhaiticus]SIS22968.1 hypothetical protein SAMN05421666_2812 [Roseovarius nanhaiticus]